MKVKIIGHTSDYVVVQKPPGMLSQSDISQDSDNVVDIMSKQLKKPLHLLTRLDRPVAGILILSKKKPFTKYYLRQQTEGEVKKNYLAIIEGKLDVETANWEHYMVHDKKKRKTFVSDKPQDNYNKAQLSVQRVEILDNYTIISVSLNAGRFHQIRAQLSHVGHPIKGDVKYGARRKNKDRSIYLFANQIEFKDMDRQPIIHKAIIPDDDTLWQIAANKI